MVLRSLLLVSLILAWSESALAQATHNDVRALLDRWLGDQNEGDFDDYQKLYGDEFAGVKRSATRSTTFDRTGWLQDRKRMFGKKMTVEATDVRIFATKSMARVVFVQHWSSGNYSDVGPKQLVLRNGGGGYRIVREELFASDTRKSGTVDLADFHGFAFVMDDEVIVSTRPDEAWAAGPAEIEKTKADRFLIRAKRRVDMKKLPPELTQLVGSPVRLMDSTGLRCEARLGGLLLRSRVVAADIEDEPPFWSATANFLVAKIDGDRKACAGATWARSATLPVPPIVIAESPNADLKARALAAFRALPETHAIQRRFVVWYAGQHRGVRKPAPSWFAHRKQGVAIRLIRSVQTGETLLSLSATINEGGCEDGVLGSLWALWQVDGAPESPHLVLRNQPDESMTLRPTAAVDVNGDGRVELLFDGFSDYASANVFGQPQFLEHGIVRALDGSYVDIKGPETPILICPC